MNSEYPSVKRTIQGLIDLWSVNGAQTVTIEYGNGRRIGLCVGFQGNTYRFPVDPGKIKSSTSFEAQEAKAWDMLLTLTENYFFMNAEGQAELEKLLSPYQQSAFLNFKLFRFITAAKTTVESPA